MSWKVYIDTRAGVASATLAELPKCGDVIATDRGPIIYDHLTGTHIDRVAWGRGRAPGEPGEKSRAWVKR